MFLVTERCVNKKGGGNYASSIWEDAEVTEWEIRPTRVEITWKAEYLTWTPPKDTFIADLWAQEMLADYKKHTQQKRAPEGAQSQ